MATKASKDFLRGFELGTATENARTFRLASQEIEKSREFVKAHCIELIQQLLERYSSGDPHIGADLLKTIDDIKGV